MRTDDAGDNCMKSAATCLPDFGSSSTCTPTSPKLVCGPIKSDTETSSRGKLRVYRSRTGGNEWEPLTKGLPQSDCYVNVLRDAMAVDSLDSCGVYFGTTGGQVYASSDAGDNWAPYRQDLPAVFRSKSKPCHDRVVLPAHLRTLAKVDGELTLEVLGDVTPNSIVDALELRYPMLRGTSVIKSAGCAGRLIRFFGEEDLSHDSPDAKLPSAIDPARTIHHSRRHRRRLDDRSLINWSN